MTLIFSPVSDGLAYRVPCTGKGEWWQEASRETKDHRVDIAKADCRRCPVFDACRTWATAGTVDPCPGMVAGGLTTRERNRWRSERERWLRIVA